MRILFVLPSISYRGGERYAYLLAKGFHEIGHKTKILVGRVEEPSISISKPVKLISSVLVVNKIIQNNWVYFFFSFPLLLILLLLNTKNVDLIDTESGFALWASVIVGKIRGVKVVWTCHVFRKEHEHQKFPKSFIGFLFGKIDKFFVKRLDGIKTVSERNKKGLKKVHGFINPAVIYPAIDLKRFENPNPGRVIKKYNIKGKRIIFMPAVFHQQKKQEFALKCFEKALGKYPNMVLIFSGGGADEERIKKIADRLGLSKNVIFAGVLKGREITDYYKASTLILIPYWRHEGCPVVPFEALVCGTMPLVARGSGASDILEKEKIGIVVDSKIELFSGAILDYLQDPSKFEKLKIEGKKFVYKYMSQKKIAKDNLNFYRTIFIDE